METGLEMITKPSCGYSRSLLSHRGHYGKKMLHSETRHRASRPWLRFSLLSSQPLQPLGGHSVNAGWDGDLETCTDLQPWSPLKPGPPFLLTSWRTQYLLKPLDNHQSTLLRAIPSVQALNPLHLRAGRGSPLPSDRIQRSATPSSPWYCPSVSSAWFDFFLQ